jgi:class 3 adenylate cyclase
MTVEGEPMDSTTSLPTGTVTFLFTDIEGSTRLWEQHPQAMDATLTRHDALADQIITQYGGVIVRHRGDGDSLFAVFARTVETYRTGQPERPHCAPGRLGGLQMADEEHFRPSVRGWQERRAGP